MRIAVSGLLVCDFHRMDMKLGDVVDENGWQFIERHMRSLGYIEPARNASRLLWGEGDPKLATNGKLA